MRTYLYLAAAAAVCACAPQVWAAEGAPPKSVEIKGVKDPELQPYRIMAAGFAAMEKHRALAPSVHDLRFRLMPRKNAPAGIMDTLTLRIEGEQTAIDVPLDAGHAFVLPRSDSAADDNAKLNLNRKQSYIRWLPVVRSAGVPSGHIRLGDARMECQILVAVVKKMVGFAVTMAGNGLLRTSDWCSHKEVIIPTFTSQPISSATLLHGGERIALQLADDQRDFKAPIADQRYGHDTLIEVVYGSAAAAAP